VKAEEREILESTLSINSPMERDKREGNSLTLRGGLSLFAFNSDEMRKGAKKAALLVPISNRLENQKDSARNDPNLFQPQKEAEPRLAEGWGGWMAGRKEREDLFSRWMKEEKEEGSLCGRRGCGGLNARRKNEDIFHTNSLGRETFF